MRTFWKASLKLHFPLETGWRKLTGLAAFPHLDACFTRGSYGPPHFLHEFSGSGKQSFPLFSVSFEAKAEAEQVYGIISMR
jgi:hypothetical protein